MRSFQKLTLHLDRRTQSTTHTTEERIQLIQRLRKTQTQVDGTERTKIRQTGKFKVRWTISNHVEAEVVHNTTFPVFVNWNDKTTSTAAFMVSKANAHKNVLTTELSSEIPVTPSEKASILPLLPPTTS
ncbi:uncharacterized protein LOC142330272 [Lycorma delicatula]|uniref:uncharacterized protein LOC142330272 n=1 Tax=Lycorma delicatula TaxID=130591 RepID=UPI003F5150D1